MRTAAFLLLFTAVAAAEVDFQREVRPILSDACFHCHGPDPNTRQAGLRLDVAEGAFGERPSGKPIVPGNPGDSLLYQRVTHENDALRMPPSYSHKTLTDEQIVTLEAWIEQGAPFDTHWSFDPPVRPEPPAVEREDWVRNPIDRFILARLEREGLAPAPEADRRTLIRRVALDLTGLPPEPAEVEAFVADKSPDAYEKVVDRLLASSAWGEHRARYWLDAARYGDTHGLHIDNYREIWPYRDWVIEAFNQNMPFDQFTVEQLAGDLLQNPTRDQLVATGFHRCNVTTNEGGVIEEEVAVMYAKDRADTTGAVFLGMTIGCATCHDHKFDPISQKDFYQMTAFFRNTEQRILDGNVHDSPPVLMLRSPEDDDRWRELDRAESKLLRELALARGRAQKPARKAHGKDEPPTGAFDESEIFALDLEAAKLRDGAAVGSGPLGLKALEVGEEGYAEPDARPELSADRPFTIAAWVRVPEEDGGGAIVSRHVKNDEEESRGWSFEIGGERPQILLWGDRGRQMGVRAEKDYELEPGWRHLAVAYDGKRTREGLTLYVDGRRVPSEAIGNTIRTLEGSIVVDAPVWVGRRDESFLEDGAIADVRVLEREALPEEIPLLAGWGRLEAAAEEKFKKLSEIDQEAAVAFELLRSDDGEYRAAARERAEIRAERREIERRTPVTHVMVEKEDSKPHAHILHRGEYDQRREKVEAGTPGVLPPMPDDLPRNRMGLAKWLVSDENPLTARVTANRYWQQAFGTGIVESAEDFGSQGTPPTHPELLDWLAVDFRESGWDVKRFFRQMVLSATYRQAAQATPEKIEADPQNRLLSRGPRFRMDGEMLRDQALAAADLLHSKIGGPSVKPYQPGGIWETVAMKGSNTRFYSRDDGAKLYRRSLYTFWKRSAPPPAMQIFNAPTREVCTVRRERTNTPLQALVTMNDPQFVEAARRMAGLAVQEDEDFDARLDWMTERLLARPLESREREVVREAYREYLRHYDSNPRDARALLAVGASETVEGPANVEQAAWTMVANQLLNLDEALNK